jgi:chromosome segregation ATPase
MPATLLRSSDIAQEVATLQEQLRDAELVAQRACRTDADRHADQLRDRLEQKRIELSEAEQEESRVAAEDQHQQQLVALLALENELLVARTTCDSLKKQIAELPAQLNRAQFQHSQLLRARSELKRQIGVIA